MKSLMNYYIANHIAVYPTLLAGWHIASETLTEPTGYRWMNNGKNPFKANGGYEHALVKVYTMQDWEHDGSLNLTSGQVIAPEVFRELRDCVPPKYYRGWFQVGEAAAHDEETGESLYRSFVRCSNDDDYYMYVGLYPTDPAYNA